MAGNAPPSIIVENTPPPIVTPAKSWKTTASGAAAFCAAAVIIFTAVGNGEPINWTAVMALVIPGIGLILAKDSNVTGGTKSTLTKPPAEQIAATKAPPLAALFLGLLAASAMACATAAGVQGSVPFDAGGGVHGAVVIGATTPECTKHVTTTFTLPNGGMSTTDAVVKIHNAPGCP